MRREKARNSRFSLAVINLDAVRVVKDANFAFHAVVDAERLQSERSAKRKQHRKNSDLFNMR